MRSKFLFLLIGTLSLAYLSNQILSSDELVMSSLSEELSKEQIRKIFSFQKKWEWVTYAIVPLLILIKISMIAAIIDLGCFLFNKNIKFRQLFNIVVKAEFIFILVIIFKTAWFYFFQDNYTLKDLQYFYPLSAINITGYEGLDPWWVYPLQVFNVFELAYWLVLAYLLGKALHANFDKGISIVASSYGVALLIWVVGVMFFTLNAS